MDCSEPILPHVPSGAGIPVLSAGEQIVSHCAISHLVHDFSVACHSLELKHESDTWWVYGRKSFKTKFQFNLLPSHCKISTYITK